MLFILIYLTVFIPVIFCVLVSFTGDEVSLYGTVKHVVCDHLQELKIWSLGAGGRIIQVFLDKDKLGLDSAVCICVCVLCVWCACMCVRARVF